jgi:hypothetical protein
VIQQIVQRVLAIGSGGAVAFHPLLNLVPEFQINGLPERMNEHPALVLVFEVD